MKKDRYRVCSNKRMALLFSKELQLFIENVEWIWAKTYADTWPHYYIVKEKALRQPGVNHHCVVALHGLLPFARGSLLQNFQYAGVHQPSSVFR